MVCSVYVSVPFSFHFYLGNILGSYSPPSFANGWQYASVGAQVFLPAATIGTLPASTATPTTPTSASQQTTGTSVKPSSSSSPTTAHHKSSAILHTWNLLLVIVTSLVSMI